MIGMGATRYRKNHMLEIGDRNLSIHDVSAVARGREIAHLHEDVAERVGASQEVVRAWLAADKPVYGVTRGLGNRASTVIPPGERAEFSKTALRARAAGAGGYFDEETVRAALFVRVATLARGGVGVRLKLVESLLAMLNEGVVPVVPRVGSIGTSDLLLCANLSLPVVGEGRAKWRGELLSGADAMAAAGIPTIELNEIEGLALCSSNAFSIGLAALALKDADYLLDLVEVTLAMTYEAFVGNPSPFDPRVAAAHPGAGQEDAARRMRALLKNSALNDPGVPRRVQDPISMRSATHVQGAARTAFDWAREAVETELNSASSNPLVLARDHEVLSTGNFHSAALAIALDAFRLALTQVGTMSSERIARLMDSNLSGLPAMLTRHGATSAGLGLLAMVARTLNREARHCSSPVTNDDVWPMNAEDQAPFTLLAARRTLEQLSWLRQIVACELIAAAQALDVRPAARPAAAVGALHAFVRRWVATLDGDRSTTEDVERLSEALWGDEARALVAEYVPCAALHRSRLDSSDVADQPKAS